MRGDGTQRILSPANLIPPSLANGGLVFALEAVEKRNNERRTFVRRERQCFVEKVVDAYPDVLESAAFGVPSPVGEQDIMIAVVPVEGRTVSPKDLLAFLQERLPKYAVPSYLDVVPELPKTGTHRVIKSDLKKRGATASTVRLEEIR